MAEGKLKKVVVAKAFKDRDGRERQIGERIEVDPDYGVELIRRGEAKEDPSAEQTPA